MPSEIKPAKHVQDQAVNTKTPKPFQNVVGPENVTVNTNPANELPTNVPNDVGRSLPSLLFPNEDLVINEPQQFDVPAENLIPPHQVQQPLPLQPQHLENEATSYQNSPTTSNAFPVNSPELRRSSRRQTRMPAKYADFYTGDEFEDQTATINYVN